jgi:hypothetical protein
MVKAIHWDWRILASRFQGYKAKGPGGRFEPYKKTRIKLKKKFYNANTCDDYVSIVVVESA